MALTPFGKAMRKLRIDRDLLLKDTADALNVSSAFLSSVESGRKSIPNGWEELLAKHLRLERIEAMELSNSITKTLREVRIPFGVGTTDFAKQVAAGLARNYGDLDQKQLEEIRAILERRRKL